MLFVLAYVTSYAQNDNNASKSDTIQIDINHADVFKAINNDSLRMLIGNVMLQQNEDEVTFACDSANLYERSKSFTAFGNIHLQQGDSIDIYADEMRYDGSKRVAYLYNNVHLTDKTTDIYSDTLVYNLQNRKAVLYKGVDVTDNKVDIYADSLEYFTNTKMAFLYDNVILKDEENTITSNYMDYNMQTEVGHYKNGGKLESKQTVLTSENATYKSISNTVVFDTDVFLKDPEYELTTDKLVYNTNTELAEFNGPTTIVNDGSIIQTNKGYYDQKNERIILEDSPIIESENTYLEADSLFFNQQTGKGYAFNNVFWQDTSQNVSIKSHYVEFDDSTDYVLASKRPLMEQIIDGDTLFMVADTLSTYQTIDSIRVLTAYGDVRIYKSNMQGLCDSLGYTSQDSSFSFYGSPILWLEDTQLYADTIILETANNNPKHFSLHNYGFIGNDTGDSVYNQIKGKRVDGFFTDGELKRIVVKQEGETLYFAQDDSLAYIGANKAEAPLIKIYMANRKVERIKFIENPKAKFETITSINPYTYKITGFEWKGFLRPSSLFDLLNNENRQVLTSKNFNRLMIKEKSEDDIKEETKSLQPNLPQTAKRAFGQKTKQP